MGSSAHEVVAVTCLAFEARIAAGPGVTVLCAARLGSLAALLEAAISQGCRGIISFGVAGGLDPCLRPGDWVIAANVIADAQRFPTDRAWTRRLLDAIPAATCADISGIDAPAATPATKALVRRRHGTVAADTESHVAAAIAAARRVPFVAARVILDPAERALPPAALVPLRCDGTPDLRAVGRSVSSNPLQFLGLVKVTFDAFRAQSALLTGTLGLGGAFAFPRAPDSAGASIGETAFAMVAAELPLEP